MRNRVMWIPLVTLVVSLSAPGLLIAGGRSEPAQQGNARGHQKAANDKKDKKEKKDKTNYGQGAATMRFHGLDLNDDGIVSRAEWRGTNRAFAIEDWNRDGALSGDELRPGAARPGPPAPPAGRDPDEAVFARMDSNRNGTVSRGEWPGTDAEFIRHDANRDGVISPYEYGVGR